ncbi:MAG: RNA polymerase subunit sigma [Nitrospira sp. WS110]|nr:RNA polymerase subunit sigma [Nitrospira sp. WS110]
MNASLLNAASTIDPKIAVRAGKGDHLAFSQLYDQSGTVLFSLAVRILGNREDAAEVLQSLYIDVWRKTVRYDVGRGTPIAWLLTLTRSRAIERLRSSSLRVPRQDESSDGIQNLPAGEFEAPADQALRTVISKTLSELPQVQRQAIELSYYEGLAPVEIATRLSQPLDAVTARLRLGLSKLRESLLAYWEHDKSA